MISTRRGFASFSVDDLDAARRFYEDVMGVRVTVVEQSLILHLDGGSAFFVYPKEDHVPATFTIWRRRAWRCSGTRTSTTTSEGSSEDSWWAGTVPGSPTRPAT